MNLAKRIFVFVKKLPSGLQTMLSITHAVVSSWLSSTFVTQSHPWSWTRKTRCCWAAGCWHFVVNSGWNWERQKKASYTERLHDNQTVRCQRLKQPAPCSWQSARSLWARSIKHAASWAGFPYPCIPQGMGTGWYIYIEIHIFICKIHNLCKGKCC